MMSPSRSQIAVIGPMSIAPGSDGKNVRMQGDVVRRRVVVHGRVQGVFFRDSARQRARSLGVAGWVRNRADGTVEAVIEGPPDAVEQMLEFLRTGPRSARVDGAVVADEAPEGLSGFEIR